MFHQYHNERSLATQDSHFKENGREKLTASDTGLGSFDFFSHLAQLNNSVHYSG